MCTELIAFNIIDKKMLNSNNIDSVFDRIIICKSFFDDKLMGSFFSCIYDGKLRIHLVFNEETNLFDDDIFKLIKISMEVANMNHGVIWLRRTIQSIISYIGDRYTLTSNPEDFYYYSTEYVMRRDRLNKKFINTVLEVRPYEEMHIDKYLVLLNDAMSFFVPPHDFVSEKNQYLQEFMDYKNKDTFEAFWKDGKLVGLYWIVGIEVDTIGVSSDFQRLGYGAMILTRAIEKVFQQNPYAEYAVLYAVGWNAKAQSFYKKYGMEINKQHKIPYNIVNPIV